MNAVQLASLPHLWQICLQVVAVGSGKGDDKGNIVKPNVEVNSTVMYSKYAGAEFEGDDDTQYIVVRESDILATLA